MERWQARDGVTLQRENGLDESRNTSCWLGVTNVRFGRADDEWPLWISRFREYGGNSLRFSRVAGLNGRFHISKKQQQ